MEYVYIFVERGSGRAAASSEHDGSNLPGGSNAWRWKARLDASDMIETSGVIGLGNAHEILEAVREHGLFINEGITT